MNLETEEDKEWEAIIKSYVSPTSLFNYFMEDPLLDYLNKYGFELGFKEDECPPEVKMIMEKGCLFESKVISKLREMKIDIIEIIAYDSWIEGYYETRQLMKIGYPVICQGYLINHENQTKGRPDIIIRADILKLLNPNIITDDEIMIPSNLGNWHYRVIDIKMSNIFLSSDGNRILNNKLYKAYKAQVLVYNLAVGLIQGYLPNKGYLLGRSSHNYDNTIYHNDCFSSISTIDYMNYDNEVITRLESALEWKRMLNNIPLVVDWNWEMIENENVNLRPNMKNKYDYKWRTAKKQIAEQRNELTLLWNCGVAKRNKLLGMGINTWEAYRDYCKNSTGFNDRTLYHILDINLTHESENQNKFLPLPGKLNPELDEFIPRKDKPFVVLDLETTSNINDDFEFLPEKGGCEYIFLIGITIVIPVGNGKMEYRYFPFHINQLNLDDELKVIKRMCNLVRDLLKFFQSETITFYHWSPAEVNFINNLVERQDEYLDEEDSKTLDRLRYSDILSVFKYQPIVVKGAYNFSIKTIGTALYNLGLIKTTWKNDDTQKPDLNGFAVMMQINKYNEEAEKLNMSLRNFKEINDIIIYNMVDCNVLAEIIVFLQNTYGKN
jgi:hypothetical protein